MTNLPSYIFKRVLILGLLLIFTIFFRLFNKKPLFNKIAPQFFRAAMILGAMVLGKSAYDVCNAKGFFDKKPTKE